MHALRSSLCEFGLNPQDWKFVLREERRGLRYFVLNSRRSRHFSLRGWASGERWLELEWIEC